MKFARRDWGILAVGVVIAGAVVSRWRPSTPPQPDSSGLRGRITLGHLELGMDSEIARDKLGGLDGSSMQMGDKIMYLEIADLDSLELVKVAEEEDVYKVAKVVSPTLEIDDKPVLHAGDSRQRVQELLGEDAEALALGPGKGKLRIRFEADKIKSFELWK